MVYHDFPSLLPYNTLIHSEFLEQGCSCAVLDACDPPHPELEASALPAKEALTHLSC